MDALDFPLEIGAREPWEWATFAVCVEGDCVRAS